MPSVNRSDLIPTIHKMIEGQGFWGKIGEAALLADETNLEILVKAYPKAFEGHAKETPRWMPRLYISKMGKTAQ